MPVWSSKAIDYSKGLVIYDPLTKKVFSQTQAERLHKDVQRRLVMTPNKVGCMVKTLEELKLPVINPVEELQNE